MHGCSQSVRPLTEFSFFIAGRRRVRSVLRKCSTLVVRGFICTTAKFQLSIHTPLWMFRLKGGPPCSSFIWLYFHALYFIALQSILRFYSWYLNKLLRIFSFGSPSYLTYEKRALHSMSNFC